MVPNASKTKADYFTLLCFNKLEAEEIQCRQADVGSRTRKSIRLLKALRLEKEIDSELNTALSLTTEKSIGIKQTIFKDGKALDKCYAAAATLTPFERKRMSSGLSGIMEIDSSNKG